jgi:Undecaprenyl-phosphate glucose phosphotransferase
VRSTEALSFLANRKVSLAPSVVGGLIGLLDVGVIFACAGAMYFGYLGLDHELLTQYLTITILASLMLVQSFSISHFYELDALMFPERYYTRMLVLIGAIFLLLISALFALKLSAEFSRVWLFGLMLLSAIAVPFARFSVAHVLKTSANLGRLRRNIVIVGGGAQAERLIERLETPNQPWNRIVAVFDERSTRRPASLGDHPVLPLGELPAFSRQEDIHQVLIALPWNANERIVQVLGNLKTLPADVGLSPDLALFDFTPRFSKRFWDLTVVEVSSKPVSGWGYFIKALSDRVLGALILLACLPLLAVIALAVKLTSEGPVFFSQERLGFNNRTFRILKFRTMYTHMQDDHAEKLTTREDPRVTPVGRFLRRWSLDELPQIFNVMTGDMSLVGPRPHAARAKAGSKIYEQVLDTYAQRHRVKPGITGWAQVNGWRGETDTEEKLIRRVEHDLAYIESWSPVLDLKILILTAWAVVRGDSAY